MNEKILKPALNCLPVTPYFQTASQHFSVQVFIIKPWCFILKILAFCSAFFIKSRCEFFDFLISFAPIYREFYSVFRPQFLLAGRELCHNSPSCQRASPLETEDRALGVSLLALQ